MNTASAHMVPQPAAEGVLARAVLQAGHRLGLRNVDLASVLGTSEASVSRLSRGRAIEPSSKEGELALLLLRLFRSLDALVGGKESQARAWLQGFNTHLGAVPAERIRNVEGLVDVVRYLDAMRGRL